MRELLLRRFPLSVKRFFDFLSKIFFSEACSCLTHSIFLYSLSEKFRISARTVCGDHPSPTGISMMSAHYPTDKGVAARVEELLREQLLELGEDPANLAPHLILQNMQCEVYPTSPWCISGRTSRSSASSPNAPIRASCGVCSPAMRVNRSSKKKRAEPAPPFSYAERLPFFKEDSLSL